MNALRPLAVIALLAAAPAHAGKTGAGPAASGAPAIGSIVTPGSHALLNTPSKDDRLDRITPGSGGVIVLEGEQLARAAAALRAFDGASVQGDLIRAPTVMADGTPAVIALHTGTGRLSVTRQED